MKARLDKQIVISRHSLGMPVHAGEQGTGGTRRLALDRVFAMIDSLLREATAMLAYGFEPENGMLCGAHWNRVHIHAQYIQGTQV